MIKIKPGAACYIKFSTLVDLDGHSAIQTYHYWCANKADLNAKAHLISLMKPQKLNDWITYKVATSWNKNTIPIIHLLEETLVQQETKLILRK